MAAAMSRKKFWNSCLNLAANDSYPERTSSLRRSSPNRCRPMHSPLKSISHRPQRHRPTPQQRRQLSHPPLLQRHRRQPATSGGLLCLIRSDTTQWFKWLELQTLSPRDYVDVTTRYRTDNQRLSVIARPRGVTQIPMQLGEQPITLSFDKRRLLTVGFSPAPS